LPTTAPVGTPEGTVSDGTGGAFGTGEGVAVAGAAGVGPGDSRAATEPAFGVEGTAGPVPDDRLDSHLGGWDGAPPRRIEASSCSSAGPSRSTLPAP
jgi:hypothetical protein